MPLIIDTDATLVTAHSEKEQAAPTFKRGFGFHPLWAFADHGPAGTGEPLTCLLRKGNAGSDTAADRIAVVKAALAQLPGHKPGTRPGRKILIRADGAGGTHEFLNWLVSQRLSYSVGFTLPTVSPPRWRRCRRRVGRRPTTPTGRSARARGSPTSPDCWTSSRGRPGCR